MRGHIGAGLKECYLAVLLITELKTKIKLKPRNPEEMNARNYEISE